MRSNGSIAKWFWALTPVALRAPSVSAQNQKRQEHHEPALPQAREKKQKS